VKSVADDLCQGRLTLFLEGGYRLDALTESVAATIRGIRDGAKAADSAAGSIDNGLRSRQRAIIDEIKETQAPLWPDLF